MIRIGATKISSSVQREERKTIHEECIICDADNLTPSKGIILNESASGALIKTDITLRPNLRVYILPIKIGELNYENATSLIILNHPLTRSGTVVRIEDNGNAGIKFDLPKPNQANFNRWYRDDTTITALTDNARVVIKIQGNISIDAGSFVNSLINKIIQDKNDLLISTSDIHQIHSTASTVIKSTIKNILDKNIHLTLITGPEGSPSSIVATGLDKKNHPNLYIYQMNNMTLSTLEKDIFHQDSKKVNIEQFIDALVVSHSYTALERYCHPLNNIKFKIEKCKGINNCTKIITEKSPQFIIIDFELKHCDHLLELNRININSLHRPPCLILVGPQYIENLVKTSLKMQVGEYLFRPCSNDDYLGALQRLIKQLPKEFMEKHLKKIRDKDK